MRSCGFVTSNLLPKLGCESIDFVQDMLANYIERLMNKCLDELIRSGCIELKEAQQAPQGVPEDVSLPWANLLVLSYEDALDNFARKVR